MSTRFSFPGVVDKGVFLRAYPFSDARAVVVRRGADMQSQYGLLLSESSLSVQGQTFLVTRHRSILSPPVLAPGQPLLSPGMANAYQPVTDVVRFPDAHLLIRRAPDGFSDEEVATILQYVEI